MSLKLSQVNLPKNNKGSVINIGNFDGFHLAHIKIFEDLKNHASKNNLIPIILSFSPHPRELFSSNNNFKILNTFTEKKYLIEKLKLNNFFTLDFNEIKEMEPNYYIENILIKKFNLKTIIIGYDHRFGKDRKGDINLLIQKGKEFNFDIIQIEKQEINNEIISSTKIREYIKNNKLEEAKKLLGYDYFFIGKVIHGDGRGKKNNFPTANILLEKSNKLMPNIGVYFVSIEYENNIYFGMMNYGYNPTYHNDLTLKIEVHILDFSKNIYGQNLKINFLKKIREEMKFNSEKELLNQIQNDKLQILNLISNIKK